MIHLHFRPEAPIISYILGQDIMTNEGVIGKLIEPGL